MCGLGAGEIIGGIGMGIIVDKIGVKKSCFVNMFLILLQTILVCAYIVIDRYGYLAYIMTIVWGMQDSSISIHLEAILGFEFTNNKEPFAIDVLLESIAVFMF
jgi:predicted MFS family arabinose efflux permease